MISQSLDSLYAYETLSEENSSSLIITECMELGIKCTISYFIFYPILNIGYFVLKFN